MPDKTQLTEEELQAQIAIAQQRKAEGFKSGYEELVQKWGMQIQGFPEFSQDGRIIVIHKIVEAANGR